MMSSKFSLLSSESVSVVLSLCLLLFLTIIITQQQTTSAAPVGQSYCRRIIEAGSHSKWCDASGCLIQNPDYALCANRGACVIRPTAASTTTTTFCTDCSYQRTGSNAISECRASSDYTDTPATIAVQVEQISRQLAVPFVMNRPARFVPESMQFFDEVADEEITRPGFATEVYRQPKLFLFLDDHVGNSSYNKLRFGVTSPIFGYTTDPTKTGTSLDKAYLTYFNYYMSPQPLCPPVVDYNANLEFADLNVPEQTTAFEVTLRKSETDVYIVNEDAAIRDNFWNREPVPNIEGGVPFQSKFRPIVKQGLFFRRFRSMNMTRRVAAVAEAMPHEQSGVGNLFELSANYNSFQKNVSNFSAPVDALNALQYSVKTMAYGTPSTPSARFLLPGYLRMKLTTQTRNWYVPLYTWRIGVWAGGENPLLIYQGLEASPAGTGSTTTSSIRTSNTLLPVAPLDIINETLYPSESDLDSVFEYEAKPINIEAVGNLCTLMYLANGSLRVIFHRHAHNHEYIGSQYVRHLFEELYLANGTSNYTHIYMKHASFGDDFVLYTPGSTSIWVFGRNSFGRFAHPSFSRVNDTMVGEQINLTFNAIHINDTVRSLALSDEFMVVSTSTGQFYYAGNSLYGTSYFAACFKPNYPQYIAANTALQHVPALTFIDKVYAGIGFTIFTRTQQVYVGGCGREFVMTPFFPPGQEPSPTLYDRFAALSGNAVVRKVCTGTHYACIFGSNRLMSCWGVLSTNAGQRVCSGSANNFQRDLGALQSGDDIQCGHDHVIIQRYNGPNAGDGSDVQAYMSCGANNKGQLAAAYQLSGDSSNDRVRPLFAAPNKMINAATADNSAQAQIAYPPVYEVYSVIAVRDATYGLTQPRRHISVDNLWANWITNIGRPPPTGWHVMHPTFGGGSNPYYIDFTSFPGVPLFTVSNQTQGSTWTTPTDSATHLGYELLFNATQKTLKPDLGAGANPYAARNNANMASRNYFVNWHKFLYNQTSYEELTGNPRVVITSLAMNVPHFIVTMGTGEVFVLGWDALPCYGESVETWDTVKAWCDGDNMKRIIWMASGQTVPAGYTDALTTTTWISLHIKFRAHTLKRNLNVINNIFLNSSVFPESQPVVEEFYNQSTYIGWTWAPPCSTMANPLDCGGAIFYEPFMKRPQTQIVTATTLSSFPVNGVRVDVMDVEPTMGKFMIQMTPVLASLATTNPISQGDVGIRGTNQNNMGFLNACIFMKIGGRAYYVNLLPGGTFLVCSLQGSLAAGYSLPGSLTYSPTDGTPVTKRWELIKDNSLPSSQTVPGYLRIRNIDPTYGSNYDPNYEINDVYFMLGCGGAVMVPNTIQDVNRTYFYKSFASFMLFTNDSIDELNVDPQWWEKETNTTTPSSSWTLQERLYNSIGCDGGLVVPIHPMKEMTSFHTFVQTLNPLNTTEEIVITLLSPHFSSLHVKYQFVIGAAGPRIETILDTTTWNNAFKQSGRGVVASCNNPAGHPLKSFPNHWNSFSMVHDITTATTEIWWNGNLACTASNWLGLAVGQPLLVSGVYLGVRALQDNFYAVARFRELVMCDSRTPGFKRYGCSANEISYKETSNSQSVSLSESFSIPETESESLHPTDSDTLTQSSSDSLTFSDEPTISKTHSETMTGTDSNSLSASLEASASNSTSFSMTETFSSIHIHRLHLLEFNDDLVDSNLIRRTGILLSFYIQGDLWNPYADWVNKPAGYLLFESDLNRYENPNALGYSYIIGGVITAVPRPENFSILDVRIGPSGNYNSGRDETVTFRPRVLGCASKILPPNNISITIPGAGFFVSTSDKLVEVMAMGGVVVSVFALGPSSMVVRFASNLIITNFQCYNNEYFPQTWMFNPLRLRIADSFNLGHAIGNLIMIVAVFSVFLIGMLVVRIVHNRGWHKTQGNFGWPSLPIILSLLFVPGLIFGSWRTAFEAESALYYMVPLATMVIIFIPLVYLYGQIMDDANFSARFEYRDETVLAIRAKKYPIFSQFQLPGQWIATDKYGEFVRRNRFLFAECAENRKYWVLYEICVLLMESFICSITNTKYSFCGIQMLVVFLMRFALFVSALRLRPRSASGMHWVIIILYAGQAGMALLFAAYAFQSLTNTLRSFVGYMMVGSSFTFAALAILCATGAAHERFLEAVFYRVLKRESEMTKRADPYVERNVEDIQYVDEDQEMMEKQLEEKQQQDTSSGENTSDNSGDQNNNNSKLTSKMLNEKNAVHSPRSGGGESPGAEHGDLKEISVIKNNDNNNKDGKNPDHTTIENPLDDDEQQQQEEESEEEKQKRKAAEEKANAKRKEKRNIWKLIAMEEASDAPTKNFSEYDEL